MRGKPIAALLICAVTLLTVTPSKTFAQTAAQPVVAQREQNSNGAQAIPGPALKARFAREVAKIKTGALSEPTLKRLERERLGMQATQTPKSGFSRKKIILAVVIVVVITGLAIVLAHNGVDPKPRCEDEPGTPDCIP